MIVRALVDIEVPDIESFIGRYSYVSISSINGEKVIGYCEACEYPICKNDDFDTYESGMMLCRICGE